MGSSQVFFQHVFCPGHIFWLFHYICGSFECLNFNYLQIFRAGFRRSMQIQYFAGVGLKFWFALLYNVQSNASIFFLP